MRIQRYVLRCEGESAGNTGGGGETAPPVIPESTSSVSDMLAKIQLEQLIADEATAKANFESNFDK